MFVFRLDLSLVVWAAIGLFIIASCFTIHTDPLSKRSDLKRKIAAFVVIPSIVMYGIFAFLAWNLSADDSKKCKCH